MSKFRISGMTGLASDSHLKSLRTLGGCHHAVVRRLTDNYPFGTGAISGKGLGPE